MIKPLGVLLVLCVVIVLLLCLVSAFLWMVNCIRRGNRNKAIVLGFASAVISVFCAYATYAVAPKGGRTIAQIQLPNNREIMVRLYRYGWFEYPRVRLYARDPYGVWTSFIIISELVNARNSSLTFDARKQEITLDTAGWYYVNNNDFVNIDGGRGKAWQLAPGIDPSQEELEGIIANPTSVLVRHGE